MRILRLNMRLSMVQTREEGLPVELPGDPFGLMLDFEHRCSLSLLTPPRTNNTPWSTLQHKLSICYAILSNTPSEDDTVEQFHTTLRYAVAEAKRYCTNEFAKVSPIEARKLAASIEREMRRDVLR